MVSPSKALDKQGAKAKPQEMKVGETIKL